MTDCRCIVSQRSGRRFSPEFATTGRSSGAFDLALINVMALVPSESIFCEFPARGYLETYYSAVDPENAAFVRSVTEDIWPLSAASDSAIEVAGGPCLYALMSLIASRGPFKDVAFTDAGWRTLREVECRLQDHPSRFAHDPLLGWLSDELGIEGGGLARLLRASRWELARLDWRRPVAPTWRHSYDVVCCHYFAASASDDENELVAFLQKLGELGRPGATLLTSFVCRAAGTTIGPREFPAFAVAQRSILGYLERAGLELEDVELRSAPSKDPASSPGYEDLLFVSGRLAG